jgi:hypothetical protein
MNSAHRLRPIIPETGVIGPRFRGDDRFQYLKRNPAVVATLLFTKKLFDNPPLNCERMRPM